MYVQILYIDVVYEKRFMKWAKLSCIGNLHVNTMNNCDSLVKHLVQLVSYQLKYFLDKTQKL